MITTMMAPPKRTKTILLVEDDPRDVTLALRAFRKTGAQVDVVAVRTGVQALDYLFGTGEYAGRGARDRPSLILLDLHLPRIDGFEVLRRLRDDDRTRLLPVIILTSSNAEQDLFNGYRLGANSYLRKPVELARFTEVAHRIEQYWLELNEAPPDVQGGDDAPAATRAPG